MLENCDGIPTLGSHYTTEFILVTVINAQSFVLAGPSHLPSSSYLDISCSLQSDLFKMDLNFSSFSVYFLVYYK